MTPPEVLLFDLGGVIVRWTGVANLAALTGLTPSGVTHKFASSQTFHDYECGRCDDDTFADAMRALFSLDMDTPAFKALWQSWVEEIYEGVEHILPALRSRYTLACLSNTNHLHWEHLKQYFDFDTYFDYSFASHHLGLAKPDTAIYRHVTAHMMVEPEDIWFFDDTAANVEAAENAGMRALQVDPAEGVPLTLMEQGLVERDFGGAVRRNDLACPMAKKTWIEKRDGGKPSSVKECPNGFADIKPGEIMLLPSASHIDTFIRNLPSGTAVELPELRAALAAESGAMKSCPVVTGIHLRVAAEAAYEELEHGKKLSDITPIWRAIGPKTKTLKKLSYDYGFILEQREREGIVD